MVLGRICDGRLSPNVILCSEVLHVIEIPPSSTDVPPVEVANHNAYVKMENIL